MLQEIDSLQRDDINVYEFVEVPPVLRCRLFGEIRFDAQGTLVAQRKDQLDEHLLEAQRVKIKVLGRIGRGKALMGQVQPPIDVNASGAYPFRLERLDDPRGDIAFAAAVDPGDRGQDTALC